MPIDLNTASHETLIKVLIVDPINENYPDEAHLLPDAAFLERRLDVLKQKHGGEVVKAMISLIHEAEEAIGVRVPSFHGRR